MLAISDWLNSLGLGQFSQAFADNDIDFELLESLSEQDLEKLGVSSMGHRKKLLKAIAEHQGTSPKQAERTLHDRGAASVVNGEPEGERRQLTVLFCDLVGYTALASRLDPEDLQRIVRSYEDACAVSITRYEGYVFQRLGDGIVAFFGYPLAHEGEAERAIHAGLAILDSLSNLQIPEVGHLSVRIGIATGLVVVSSAEKGAVGETMNLASRLQNIAEVNTLVVSERVRRLAGGAFHYQDLGEHSLKGITHPTRAHRVIGLSQAASRFEALREGLLTPMVGREHEIALLLERWGQSREGEGQAVLVCGEAGIGKSRTVSALRERLEQENATLTLRFQCSPYHVNSAFYPFIDHLERELKFEREESVDSRLDKLEAFIVGHHDRPLSDARFLASMLSISSEERYGPIAMTPQKFKDETLRSLVDLIDATTRKQPSLLLYEDVHWADPSSLETLDLLVDRTRSLSLLIVLTHRPEFQNRWAAQSHVTSLNLSKLSKTQSAAMVNRIAKGKALPENLLDQILAKTDGIPLFVEELTKAVLESTDMKESADRYEYVGKGSVLTIPATLRDSLMARLDRHQVMKEVAQMGAAIGREFSYELVAAVAPMNPSQLDSALTQLTDSGLAFRRGNPPEAAYTFKHALVQDAAYDSLLKTRRQELHARIAHVIKERFPKIKDTEPEVLAHHYTQASQPRSAIPLWQKAGELALARMALTESISHLRRGLDIVATLPASAERDASELALRTPLGTASIALKSWASPDVWTSLHPALALAKSLQRNDALLPVLWGLWIHVLCVGRVTESRVWIEEMLDTAKASGDTDLLIAGHAGAHLLYFYSGELETVLQHHDQVMTLYDAEKHRHLVGILNHDPKTLSNAFAALAAWRLGYPDRAVRLTEDARAHACRLGHAFEMGWTRTYAAELFNYRGDTEELRRLTKEGEQIGRDNSLPLLWAILGPAETGISLIRDGRVAEGLPMLKSSIAIWEGAGGMVWSPYAKAVIAEGTALLGDVDGALQIIDEQIALLERPGWEERCDYAEILRLKGWMLLLKSDAESAEKLYLASLDFARQQRAKSWELRTAMSLATLWQSQGKTKEAYELLAPVYHWFTEGFDTRDLREAKALLSELIA